MTNPYQPLNDAIASALTDMWGRFLVWTMMSMNFGVIGFSMMF